MSEHLSNTELKRLHRDWRKKTNNRLALIIDGIQGPYNVGSIIRSSAAERVDFAWFSSGATTPDNTKTGKTPPINRPRLPQQHQTIGNDNKTTGLVYKNNLSLACVNKTILKKLWGNNFFSLGNILRRKNVRRKISWRKSSRRKIFEKK